MVLKWYHWCIIARIVSLVFINLYKAYGYGYNATTGNYMDDPDNPNNAENVIIQYCIDHADRVSNGENVVQNLVYSGMVPSFYNGKTCAEVNQLHRMAEFNDRISKGVDAFSEGLGIH